MLFDMNIIYATENVYTFYSVRLCKHSFCYEKKEKKLKWSDAFKL